MSMDAYLDELARGPVQKHGRRRVAPVMPDLFAAVYDEPAKPSKDRLEEVRDSLAVSARHWIDLGKPVAVAVAKAHGKVTAEMFRNEAEKRGKLPLTNGDQRALAWIPVMFGELCKEGHPQKRTRQDGSVVREYSKAQANLQCVYGPVDGR